MHRNREKAAEIAWLEPEKLLFLCYGNICRSPFAEHLWNTLVDRPVARSAGFIEREGRTTPSTFRALAVDHGVRLEGHRARWASPELIDWADAILVMDRENWRDLEAHYPEARERTFLLAWFGPGQRDEIDDPYHLSSVAAREVYRQIAECLGGLRQQLAFSI